MHEAVVCTKAFPLPRAGLKDGDPRDILKKLMEKRGPFFAQADIAVDTGDEPPDVTVDQIMVALEAHSETDQGKENSEQ